MRNIISPMKKSTNEKGARYVPLAAKKRKQFIKKNINTHKSTL